MRRLLLLSAILTLIAAVAGCAPRATSGEPSSEALTGNLQSEAVPVVANVAPFVQGITNRLPGLPPLGTPADELTTAGLVRVDSERLTSYGDTAGRFTIGICNADNRLVLESLTRVSLDFAAYVSPEGISPDTPLDAARATLQEHYQRVSERQGGTRTTLGGSYPDGNVFTLIFEGDELVQVTIFAGCAAVEK